MIKQHKQSLGFFPTPLVTLSTLSHTLGGPTILMKRDDNTGLALGGNKTRKLEYLIGDALAQDADTLITAGAAQSNHCRQTAAAAASLQLECHLLLGGQAPKKSNGNLLLDKLFGCHIHWTGNNRKGEDIPNLVKKLKKEGKKPYVIPYGGSNEIGALGFVQALKELDTQLQISQQEISHIIFASSSGGTHAGLMLGKKILNRPYQILGINIDKDDAGELPFEQQILNLANKTAQLIQTGHSFTREDVFLNSHYIGEGYGVIGSLEKEAITLTAQTEGILLDPVYTGRAMGGLMDMIRSGKFTKSESILFWHTGGAPALFAYADSLQ